MNVPWLTEFLTLAVVHLLAVASPGPDFAVTVRQCLRFGRRAGMAVAVGTGAGMAVHIIYILLGVAALLHTTPWLMQAVALLGGAYLLYLGVLFVRQALRAGPGAADVAAPEHAASSAHPHASFARSFAIGFTANVLNPKAAMFLLAVFTTLVSSSTPLAVKVFYGLWICAMNMAWFTFVSVVFTRTRVRHLFLRLGRWVDLTIGGLLGVVSLRLFWGALHRALNPAEP